jgi:threonyl-tRNA synthetase
LHALINPVCLVSRNESSGSLSGLTRVRRFHQDDAHIFCTREHLQEEIQTTLSMIHQVYTLFGFSEWNYTMSTRPEKFMGKQADWDQAETTLRSVLTQSGPAWSEAKGEGAFYGPKIDIRVKDAAGRFHQTATIQLDFQLPKRFELSYSSKYHGFILNVNVLSHFRFA